MALIFGITTVGGAIAATDEAMQLIPHYAYLFRAAQSGTTAPLRPFVPGWLVPHSPQIIEPYYLGNASFWTPERLAAWALPLLCWMAYLTALGATMWAWNVILRRRWMDNDRLAFPNVQLPMTLCREAGFGGAASGRVFWSGVLTALFIESLNPLQQQFPQIPSIPISIDLSPTLQALPAPWNALAPMTVMWPTLYLGICYFIPLDILFSAGFFFLFRKGLEVFGRSMGWRELGWDVSGFPYARSQAAGAWTALFFLLVWAERRHLWGVLRAAFTLPTLPALRERTSPDALSSSLAEDADEFGSYRWAGRILVGGTLFLLLFSVASGMSLGVALVFYAFFWMLQVTTTRVYCQVGPPTLECYFLHPQPIMVSLFGTSLLSPASATHLGLFNWLTRNASGHPMGHIMGAFYIGRQTGVRPRPFGKWMLIGFVVGGAACLLAYLHYAYRVGEDQWRESGWRGVGVEGVVARVGEWTGKARGPQWQENGFMAAGCVVTLLLAKAGTTIIGFPLHPVGFALAMSYGVEYSWPAFLFMAAFKFFTLRYGGRRLFESFAPFFLGMTLGGLITPVGWGLVAWLFQWYT